MSYPRQEYTTVLKFEDMNFIQAINANNVSRCMQLISSDKECVNEKGWYQQTPLHQACLSGQVEIAKLLIQHGANPNAINSFEETPLHYACRRGNVPIVHHLLKNGADQNARDKRGRTCMHFAVLGGSVIMLHYLGLHTDLKFDIPDFTGKNILSICCEHRHTVAVSFLLRNGRVDPSLADLNGMTPLHVAAEKGYGELAWNLLKVGGCSLLHIQDKKSLTPCNVSKMGKSENHKKLFTAMKYYSKQDPNLSPRGPILLWYFLLFMPFTFCGLVFFLSTVLNGHSSYFSAFMFSLLVIYVARQSHRINHISRWPNPIFMGGFMGGVLHCIIAYTFKIVPGLWPCPIIMIWSTFLITIVIYLLWYLSIQDPGVDTQQKVCPTLGHTLSVLDIAEGRCRELDFCVFTEMIYGDRTKYCRICEKPMLDMDHHCLFLNNCVARNNHRQFVILVFILMVLQLSFLFSLVLYLNRLLAKEDIFQDGLGDPVTPYIYHLFKMEPWLFALSSLCLISFIWEITLLLAQLSVIMRGNTTYFASKSANCSRSLSWDNMIKNLIIFFVRPEQNTKFRSETLKKANLV